MDDNKPPNKKEPENGYTISTGVILFLCALFVLVVFIKIFVLPSFENVFHGQGELPFSTRFLLAASEFFQTYFPIIIIAILVFYYVLKKGWEIFNLINHVDSDSDKSEN